MELQAVSPESLAAERINAKCLCVLLLTFASRCVESDRPPDLKCAVAFELLRRGGLHYLSKPVRKRAALPSSACVFPQDEFQKPVDEAEHKQKGFVSYICNN